jgi:hypothetical protein
MSKTKTQPIHARWEEVVQLAEPDHEVVIKRDPRGHLHLIKTWDTAYGQRIVSEECMEHHAKCQALPREARGTLEIVTTLTPQEAVRVALENFCPDLLSLVRITAK